MRKSTRLTIISIISIIMIAVVPLGFFVRPVHASIVARYGDGFLEEIAPGKYKMHLEGSPYEMGFQQGYLGGDSASRLASEDWFKSIVTGMLGASDAILLIVLGDILDYNRLVDVVGSVVNEATLQSVKFVSGDTLDTALDKSVGFM